jgi:hypothetical protein
MHSRPFQSVEAMNLEMILRWNETVSEVPVHSQGFCPYSVFQCGSPIRVMKYVLSSLKFSRLPVYTCILHGSMSPQPAV